MTTIQEALQAMYDVGTRQIDVYYTGMIEDGKTDWQVDVILDIAKVSACCDVMRTKDE